MSLHPPLRCCWMKRGKQKTIPAPGQQRRHHWFGGYNWRSDEVWAIDHHRRDSEGFARFIEHLMAHTYPTEKVVLVMDNARFHTSAMAQAALSLFQDRLKVIWLPKYCPFLNPIERFWKHLKGLANVNRLHVSMQSLIDCTQY